MQTGELINIKTHIRSFDERNVSYWLEGPALILDTNDHDVTLFSSGKVLYTSQQELAVELELEKPSSIFEDINT